MAAGLWAGDVRGAIYWDRGGPSHHRLPDILTQGVLNAPQGPICAVSVGVMVEFILRFTAMVQAHLGFVAILCVVGFLCHRSGDKHPPYRE